MFGECESASQPHREPCGFFIDRHTIKAAIAPFVWFYAQKSLPEYKQMKEHFTPIGINFDLMENKDHSRTKGHLLCFLYLSTPKQTPLDAVIPKRHNSSNYLFAFDFDLYFGKTIDAFDRLPFLRFSIRFLAFAFGLLTA